MGDIGLQQCFDIAAQQFCLHDERIAAGEEDIGDLRVGPEVFDHQFYIPHGELQFIHAHKLGPAETKGAVSMAGLPLAGEKQHRLAVLVLDAREGYALYTGHILR